MHHDGAMEDITEANTPNHDEKITYPIIHFYYLIIFPARDSF
ncbi:hypothetical protein M988_3889 [Hafnia paralvei ATCC 29927]|jgi:hypothetical protein|nr:hypothetical protein M988_3889 [Hafnia paralvei ATCC 29927]